MPSLLVAATAAILATTAPAAASVLALREVQKNLVNGVDGLNGAQGVAVSPDGAHVYVTGESDNALAVFQRDPATGALTEVEVLHDGVDGVDGLAAARAVTLSADGAYAYVAGYVDDSLAVFGRDPATGFLTLIQLKRDSFGGVNGLDGAGSVTISPDGANVYVAGDVDNAVAVFSRDAVTGTVAFVQMVKDATTLSHARAVTVSPDGKHVYAAASGSDTVVVFARDPATGALSQIEVQKDDTNGVDGLDGARSVAVSPDGAQVYVAGSVEDALAVFSRDAATGALTFVQMLKNNTPGVKGLNGAYGVVVGPDGKRVYSVANVSHALAVFDRDAATGQLTYLEQYVDNASGVDGLHATQALTLSPDGKTVYATGFTDNAVAVFAVTCGDGMVDANEQCDDGNAQNGDCCSSTCKFELAGTSCPSDGNACTDDQCNAGGMCEHVPNIAPCDDGQFCTVNDTCQGGTCQGSARDCSVSGDQCNDGVCDESTDACMAQPRMDGAPCDDGTLCTQSDSCQAGVCTGTDPVACSALDQCHDAGTCDPATGACSNPATTDGAACNDGDACTQADSCQAGTCTGADPVACSALDQCHDAGTCDPATGTCDNPAKADGSACNDGDACTQVDACQAGACTGADPVACSALDQCHDAGTCDPATGACSNPVKADGSACDDGDLCNQPDSCQGGSCAGADPVACSAQDQCHDAGICDPATGACSNPAKADGSACDDGDFCTQADSCQAGACITGNPVVCAAQDQCHDPGSCDSATGSCSNPTKRDGTTCNDGNACTQADSCRAGACTGTNPVVCAAQDQCHDAGTCSPSTGLCSNPAKPNGAACNDGNGCTRTDTCQAGACAGANPVVCSVQDQCHDAGTCDPSTGACSNAIKADGTPCDDGDACTTGETCTAGTCAGTTLVDRDQDGVCDLTDTCPDVPNPDQIDSDHNGIGDACECTQAAPGRCITGGGAKTSDCLVELNPTAPAIPNPKRTGVLGVLRCTDGDPSCDLDRTADGTCTFGVAVCLGNRDPRLAKCQPTGMQSFEVMAPNPDRARSAMDRDNSLALEQGLASMGVEIRRRGHVQSAGTASDGGCSPLVRLMAPAPATAGGKAVRRTFLLRGVASDRRVDTDRITLECHR